MLTKTDVHRGSDCTTLPTQDDRITSCNQVDATRLV